MADSKISNLNELATAPDAGDLFVIVDVSDTSMSASGTTKKIQSSNAVPDSSTTVKGKVELATDAETITGSDTVRAVTPSNITAKMDTDGTLAGNLDTRIPSQKAVKTYGDRSLITTLTRVPLYAPQGFLINGKIVPSVASNNLTVAIKTLAGTDPSATDPVYCRIGDTVRSVTAALSVTKNAATNWFNAGSAELATKEIDYFVYLGYNATDGVVIGFSRIPYAAQYSDFSATATNEKYSAISTITNAAATDYYEVVGRFAATLSAGAGYTWSVPTFTPANLIQRPIYETRELSYLPVVTATAGTPTATTPVGFYIVSRNTVFLNVSITVTTVGTATGGMLFTLPMSVKRDRHPITAWEGAISGFIGSCAGLLSDNTKYRVDKYDFTTFWIINYVPRIAGTYVI